MVVEEVAVFVMAEIVLVDVVRSWTVVVVVVVPVVVDAAVVAAVAVGCVVVLLPAGVALVCGVVFPLRVFRS